MYVCAHMMVNRKIGHNTAHVNVGTRSIYFSNLKKALSEMVRTCTSAAVECLDVGLVCKWWGLHCVWSSYRLSHTHTYTHTLLTHNSGVIPDLSPYIPVSLRIALLSSFLSSYTRVPATSRSSFSRCTSGDRASWLIWSVCVCVCVCVCVWVHAHIHNMMKMRYRNKRIVCCSFTYKLTYVHSKERIILGEVFQS